MLRPFWSALAGTAPLLWWRGFRGRWILEKSPLCLPSAVALVGMALPLCVHWWPVIPTETGKPRGLWHPEWPPVTWEGEGMPVAHASMGGHHTPTHPS